MSKEKTSERLLSEIAKLLDKHEIDNEVLVCELAIIILKREKTSLKQGHQIASRVINKITKG